MFKILLPKNVQDLLHMLSSRGHEAYIVGGCVRDFLLNIAPKDWDICTSAEPDEIRECFKEFEILDFGVKHGSVTVVVGSETYEITTFRTDGCYTDHRRPDSVSFAKSIFDDLSRRDFTVNAMAYNPQVGMIDPFSGCADLNERLLRCVGNADARIEEDALRIMRALRFASVYDLNVSSETAGAIHRHISLLKYIARERIAGEFCDMLCGRAVQRVLLDYKDVIAAVTPHANAKAFAACGEYSHMAKAVSLCGAEDMITRLALFVRGMQAAPCGEDSPQYAGPDPDAVSEMLSGFKLDNRTKRAVSELVRYGGAEISADEKAVRKWLGRIGPTQLRRLLRMKKADALARQGDRSAALAQLQTVEKMAENILAAGQCFDLRGLAINGDDVIAAGIAPGPAVGVVLREVLSLVVDGRLHNEKETLLDYVRRRAAGAHEARTQIAKNGKYKGWNER